jgi:SAM-dependent methyltransferase
MQVASEALEERHPELRLQPGDAPRDRRWAEVELLGGQGEAAVAQHGEEGPEELGIDAPVGHGLPVCQRGGELRREHVGRAQIAGSLLGWSREDAGAVPEHARMDARAHWERTHRQAPPEETSWHQALPRTSLELIELSGTALEDPILDVGGGASLLVDHLLERGFRDLSVLDIAESALERARARLGDRAGAVRWIRADVTEVEFDRPFALWHDRAVFHFLVEEEVRERYLERLRGSLRPGGHAVLASFAPDGPERCSGLPIRRHDAALLLAAAGPGFSLLDERREIHITPRGKPQTFCYALLRRQP